jgi:hypothetical protein
VGLGIDLAFTLFLVPFWWQGGAVANLLLALPLLWLLRHDYPRSIPEILKGKRSRDQKHNKDSADVEPLRISRKFGSDRKDVK